MLILALHNLVLLPLLDWSGACLDALALPLRVSPADRPPQPSPFD